MRVRVHYSDTQTFEDFDVSGWGGEPIVPHTFEFTESHNSIVIAIPLRRISSIVFLGSPGE